MLAIILSVVAVVWGLWLAFMLRYPTEWEAKVDAIHSRLARYGLSSELMKRAEKGILLKALVGATVVIVLASLVETLHHPAALSAFFHACYAKSNF